MFVVTKDPERTRDALLSAAFDEIHRNGFNAARVDRILDKTDVTKGAFYHHFESKQDLGYAVLDELVRERILSCWVGPVRDADDPIAAVSDVASRFVAEMDPQFVDCGCPLNNLSQEMSPLDEGFRLRVQGVIDAWRAGLAEALERGKKSGAVGSQVDVGEASLFIVSAIQGAIGLTKNAKDLDVFRVCMKNLAIYLESLRPATKKRDGRRTA